MISEKRGHFNRFNKLLETTTEIESVLESISHGKYMPLFIEHEIDFPTFLTLEEVDLKELGIKALGSRKKIIAAIRECRAASGTRHPHHQFASAPRSPLTTQDKPATPLSIKTTSFAAAARGARSAQERSNYYGPPSSSQHDDAIRSAGIDYLFDKE